MERLDRTIAGRITVAVLAIHMVILPLLYFAVVFLVKHSNEELFINNVRSHARFIADSLEHLEKLETSGNVLDILDSVVLSGDGVYAELQGSTRQWTSHLVSPENAGRYREDFKFADHGDSVYYMSVPVVAGGNEYSLRIGFDETPILVANRQASFRGLLILSVYLSLILLLVSLIGRRVMRPVKSLQVASRNIASGQFSEKLTVETDLVEFVDLSQDLERMRLHLLGINRQLQDEIRMKEETESERKRLQHQLRHRQRLETVGTLAGGIAHELNNIMVPIMLYSDAAMDGLPEDHAARKDLIRVARAASRARGVVQQILTFSRQIGDIETEQVDVATVVRESLELVKASFSPIVKIEVDIDDRCRPVIGNPSLVGQVVMNLCTNAYQALKQASGFIRVIVEEVQIADDNGRPVLPVKNGDYVRLSIIDSGEGIDEEIIGRIFEPFFTTRGVGGGTGLGLSVVHGIVANMDGEIIVTSNIDRGARFDVYLPIFEGLVAADDDSRIEDSVVSR